MANFTKGEWVVYPSKSFITVECELGSLIYNREMYKSTVVEQTANAFLIKTSPKMYNLLHKIMLEHCKDSVLYNEIDELLEEARGE